MEITTIETCGLYSAMQAIHLPMGKPAKSKRQNNFIPPEWTEPTDKAVRINDNHTDIISYDDLNLASRLVKAGDEHAKVLRGIVVYVKIKAPIYFWNEFVTYRIGCECLSSTSTMHIECKGLTGEELQKAKAEIPMGHEQTRILMISYQTLRRMYFQRRHHRLPEWHTVCDWIEKLPFSAQLITTSKDGKKD